MGLSSKGVRDMTQGAGYAPNDPVKHILSPFKAIAKAGPDRVPLLVRREFGVDLRTATVMTEYLNGLFLSGPDEDQQSLKDSAVDDVNVQYGERMERGAGWTAPQTEDKGSGNDTVFGWKIF